MQTKNRNSRSITRKYLPIRVGKREPLLEELLYEGRIRFEGQRRYLLELHEFGVERRRIDHDLHAHQNRTPCLSLIHNCQIRKTLQRIEARRSSISRFNAGLDFWGGRKREKPQILVELEALWLERGKKGEKVGESFCQRWMRLKKKMREIRKMTPEIVRNGWRRSYTWPYDLGAWVFITCSDHVHYFYFPEFLFSFSLDFFSFVSI